MTNCEVTAKSDRGSDHRLVRMILRMDKGLTRLKTIKKAKTFQYKHTKTQRYKNRFERHWRRLYPEISVKS